LLWEDAQIGICTRESWQYPCNILFVVVGTTFYMSMVFVFSTEAKESIFCNAVYLLVDGSRQKHGKIINQSIIIWHMGCSFASTIKRVSDTTAMPVLHYLTTTNGCQCAPCVHTLKLSLCFPWHTNTTLPLHSADHNKVLMIVPPTHSITLRATSVRWCKSGNI
jgi:hypothetical protein